MRPATLFTACQSISNYDSFIESRAESLPILSGRRGARGRVPPPILKERFFRHFTTPPSRPWPLARHRRAS